MAICAAALRAIVESSDPVRVQRFLLNILLMEDRYLIGPEYWLGAC